MFWTYHRPYDDVLMLVPLVALTRIATGAADRRERIAAGALVCALMFFALERPQLPQPLPTHGLLVIEVDLIVFATANLRAGIWLAALVVLVRHAHRAVFPAVTPSRAVPEGPARQVGITRHRLGSSLDGRVCRRCPAGDRCARDDWRRHRHDGARSARLRPGHPVHDRAGVVSRRRVSTGFEPHTTRALAPANLGARVSRRGGKCISW